jgi:hypothetical protein
MNGNGNQSGTKRRTLRIALAGGIVALVSLPALTLASEHPTTKAQTAARRDRCTPPRRIGNDRGVPISTVVTHRLSCAAARHHIAYGHLTHDGNLATNDFSCHLLARYTAGSSLVGAKIGCRSGGRTFRFSWAT